MWSPPRPVLFDLWALLSSSGLRHQHTCNKWASNGVTASSGYVEGGGAYLGLCAGAYFACDIVEFALGTK